MAIVKDKWVRRFIISETAQYKNRFTLYKVTSMVFNKSSPNTISKISVWKRYSEFRKLYEEIKLLHTKLHIKEPFPVFSKRKIFGRFESEVVEQRKSCALELLLFIGRHNSLSSSEVFTKFFDSDLKYKCFNDSTHSLSSESSEDECKTIVSNAPVNSLKYASTNNYEHSMIGSNQNESAIRENGVSNTKENKNDFSIHNGASKISSNNQSNIENLSNLNFEENHFYEKTASRAIIHDGSDLMQSSNAEQYILIAAAHMSAAFRHEAIAEYEEAFTQYKLGTAHLLNGLQNEKDISKKFLIQEKVSKYLYRAERLYNRHLSCSVSMVLKPISVLNNYKIIELMGSLMIINDTLQSITRVIKSIEKTTELFEDARNYILRGKVPYMVQLFACTQTDSTVFLILEYIKGGNLWSLIRSEYQFCEEEKKCFENKKHARSFSCHAIIQSNKKQSQENQSCRIVENKDFSDETSKLLYNAQELLESVTKTLKRSNSMTNKLTKKSFFFNNEEQLLSISYSKFVSDIHIDNAILADNLLKNSSMKTNKVARGSGDITKSFESKFDNFKLSDERDGEFLVNPISSYNENIDNEGVHSIHRDSSIDREFQFEESQIFLEHISDLKRDLKSQKLWEIPESIVQLWAAEILLSMEALHQQNVIIANFEPDNILINDAGHIRLTYVIPKRNPRLMKFKSPYSSPELCKSIPTTSLTSSVDIWSFGVILYELLTGYYFEFEHPGKLYPSFTISLPISLSDSAKSLLMKILRFKPSERLTIPEIKQHSFFTSINWLELLNM